MKLIRVLLVDDHPVVRFGLAHVMDQAEDIELIGQAESGEEAIFLAKKLQPDLIMMDIHMDGLSGIDATQAILKSMPDARVVGLSSFGHGDDAEKMLAAGARAFLHKEVPGEQILDTIRRVHSGETIAHRPKAGSVSPQANSNNALAAQFGAQQKRVLELMIKGFTNPEIAKMMDISVPTARYHVSAIFKKLEVSNRAEAVAAAVRDGLLD